MTKTKIPCPPTTPTLSSDPLVCSSLPVSPSPASDAHTPLGYQDTAELDADMLSPVYEQDHYDYIIVMAVSLIGSWHHAWHLDFPMPCKMWEVVISSLAYVCACDDKTCFRVCMACARQCLQQTAALR